MVCSRLYQQSCESIILVPTSKSLNAEPGPQRPRRHMYARLPTCRLNAPKLYIQPMLQGAANVGCAIAGCYTQIVIGNSDGGLLK